jgi:hypothetical protein
MARRLHVQGDVEMCEGGGVVVSTVRKIYCTGPSKLMYIKLPMGHWLIRPCTQCFWCGQIHYLGNWEGARPWKSRLFSAPHQKHYVQGNMNHRSINSYGRTEILYMNTVQCTVQFVQYSTEQYGSMVGIDLLVNYIKLLFVFTVILYCRPFPKKKS